MEKDNKNSMSNNLELIKNWGDLNTTIPNISNCLKILDNKKKIAIVYKKNKILKEDADEYIEYHYKLDNSIHNTPQILCCFYCSTEIKDIFKIFGKKFDIEPWYISFFGDFHLSQYIKYNFIHYKIYDIDYINYNWDNNFFFEGHI